ncbi:MAG TPA: flagellar biosynthesis anti-sigma factor FlgM [Candidatus Tectomicrobia bacterium]|jgi:anti-sigma28 factor (negative regulator of flagellin synthesis)
MSSTGHHSPERCRNIRRAKQIIEETPEIREERVAAAKRALQAGTLNLHGEELAEKLLHDPLHIPALKE